MGWFNHQPDNLCASPFYLHRSRQSIATSAEDTPKGSLVRESPPRYKQKNRGQKRRSNDWWWTKQGWKRGKDGEWVAPDASPDATPIEVPNAPPVGADSSGSLGYLPDGGLGLGEFGPQWPTLSEALAMQQQVETWWRVFLSHSLEKVYLEGTLDDGCR